MTAAELANAKLTQLCSVSAKVGHWADAHNPNGSLRPRKPSLDPHRGASSGNIYQRNLSRQLKMEITMELVLKTSPLL